MKINYKKSASIQKVIFGGRYVSLNNSTSCQFVRQTTETGIPNAYYELPYVSGTSASNPATILINGAYANTFKSFGYNGSASYSDTARTFQVNVYRTSGNVVKVKDENALPPKSDIKNYALISFTSDYHYNDPTTKSNSHILPTNILPVSEFLANIAGSKSLSFTTDARWFSFSPAFNSDDRLILGKLGFGGGTDPDIEYIIVTVTLMGNLSEVL